MIISHPGANVCVFNSRTSGMSVPEATITVPVVTDSVLGFPVFANSFAFTATRFRECDPLWKRSTAALEFLKSATRQGIVRDWLCQAIGTEHERARTGKWD